jgi:hypothetical protein
MCILTYDEICPINFGDAQKKIQNNKWPWKIKCTWIVG